MAINDAVRTDLQSVSEELDGQLDTTEINDGWLNRAHHLVEERRPGGVDEWLLEDLETLIAAHFAYPTVTGANAGQHVDRVKQGQATVQYDSDFGSGPAGFASPYWDQAVTLADWLVGDAASFLAL